ncbi:MAG: hypothetical protein CVU44_10495 [Chloroflexi bacterium HGW-Chloroflexi-6]|nr:MAG: hypothetical protein CVU44_10495 [Chloroflexi bacterium HGW-Chloroflexi-6]
MNMDTQTGTNRFVNADFFTPSYRIVGKISVPSTGLMGLLNDPHNSFAEIHDARLARLPMPTKLVDHYQSVRVVKSQLFAVCLARREDLGPQAITRGGYVRVSEFPIRVTTSIYDLAGIIEWSGRFDFSVIMSEGTREFVPMYDALLTAILIPALKVDSPAILFNRKHIDLLALKSHHVDEP